MDNIKLKELIHNKINEVFAEYQKANNITNGDIDPWEVLRLEQIEIALTELVERVGEYQKANETVDYDDLRMEQQEQM